MAGHDEDACYWVDGTKYDLGGTDANAIAVADGVVYVAGTYVDDNNVYRACYWVDGTRYDLNGKKANAIAVADGIIYIAGCYEDNNITKPCYWVNGARYGMEIEANHNSFLISERFKIVTVHGDLA
jgi:flagellar basal body P-ring protein FlgI